jgi:serine protease inhibitor
VVAIGKGKAPPETHFICDRPFVLGIQHVQTKAFVFLGKVKDPELTE